MKVLIGFAHRLGRGVRLDRLGCYYIGVVGLVLMCAAQAQAVDSYVRLEVVEVGTGCGCRPSKFGVRPAATDGYDDTLDATIAERQANEGYAATYHENGPNWSGTTGFYQHDMRGAPADGESTSWTVYVWVPETYANSRMELATDGYSIREGGFKLRLDTVPAGVEGAPDVGTEWNFSNDKSLTVILPAHKTSDGKTGYVFSLTMTMDGSISTPPLCCASMAPPALLLLATGAWLMARPRR